MREIQDDFSRLELNLKAATENSISFIFRIISGMRKREILL